ncbi:MAG: serine hydrolase domain-containing protein [Dehalococcoidia bacterium]
MTEQGLAGVLPALERRVAALVRESHLPGAAAGIVRGRDLVWSGGFGFADVATHQRPHAGTLFRVASITKTFTATAILQLRDQGKLRLDDPIVRYLPEYARVQTRFGTIEDTTFRRLLSHRSGLITEGPFSYWDTLDFPSIDEVLANLGETEVAIEPDSASKYSNLGFALMGEVVARLSGLPYEEYIQQRIFDPLQMTSSTFAPNGALRDRLATGYNPHPFEDEPSPAGHTSTRGIIAAAGLYTTVEDLARWIAFQFQGEAGEHSAKTVLSGRTVAEMHQPQDIDPTWRMARCLGWMAQRNGERIYHGHGGSIHGFITQILFSTSHKTGVIVLTNEGRHSVANAIAVEMLDRLGDTLDAVSPILDWQPPKPAPAAWKRYLGRYEYWRGGLIHVEARDGSLVLALPPGIPSSLHAPAPLEPTDEPHVFRVVSGRAAGELLVFTESAGGDVTGFTLAGFRYAILHAAHEQTPPQGVGEGRTE